eukprot:217795-Alexandrium_andersonii.AAC.1
MGNGRARGLGELGGFLQLGRSEHNHCMAPLYVVAVGMPPFTALPSGQRLLPWPALNGASGALSGSPRGEHSVVCVS